MGIQVKTKTDSIVDITEYLERGVVSFLKASTRDEAIKELIEKLADMQKIYQKDEFYKAVIKREQVASTGIGRGVAIPHAKLPIYNDFFIAAGILEEGVNWGALDQVPVQIIFLIGGPDDKQSHYLSLLSELTLFLRDGDTRKKLLTLTAPEQMIQLFQS